jgi:hypothetical protein
MADRWADGGERGEEWPWWGMMDTFNSFIFFEEFALIQ